MHEDFFISGKGANNAVNARNFELLKWINANSIRTSHYPYSEDIMGFSVYALNALKQLKGKI